MTFKKQSSRGKGQDRGWNAAHKLLTGEERDERRLEGSHGKGQNLRRIQDQIRAAGDKEGQTKYIRKAVELAFGFTAKLEQVDLLWSLIFDREDRILIAKTGYGKSVVPQLLPLLTRSSVVIILLPLNALGAEQLADIQRLPLAKPIWLSARNNSMATLRRIRAGIYTHVLVSPEIACSLKFYDNVLSDAQFRKRTKAIVIDEVHLVVDWGQSFRKAYRLLKHFRNRLGCKPWFGCTATLDPCSFDELCRYTGFKNTVHIVRTSIDRPEIRIVKKQIPANKKSKFAYLFFMIENATENGKPTPWRISKGLLFFERKDLMRKCIRTMRSWLLERYGYSSKQATDAIVA
jgi:superfamily II DNA helicase RecQ